MSSKECRIGLRSEVMAERKRQWFVALGPGGEFEQNWMTWRGFLECNKALHLINAEEK